MFIQVEDSKEFIPENFFRDELADLDTKALGLSAKASLSAKSLSLSLVDEISEMVLQSPVPEESSPEIADDDSEIKVDKDLKMVSVVDISIHG